jgi:hypothetical protein
VPGRELHRPRGNGAHPVTKTSRQTETRAPTDKGPRSHVHKTSGRSLKPPKTWRAHLREAKNPSRHSLAILPHLARGPTKTGLANLADCGPNLKIGAGPKRQARSSNPTHHRAGERNLANSNLHLRGLRAASFTKPKLTIGPHCLRGPPSQTETSETARRRYTATASGMRPHNACHCAAALTH